MRKTHDAIADVTLRPRDLSAILRAARRIEDARLAAQISAIADRCERAPLADNEDPREAARVVRYLRALARPPRRPSTAPTRSIASVRRRAASACPTGCARTAGLLPRLPRGG